VSGGTSLLLLLNFLVSPFPGDTICCHPGLLDHDPSTTRSPWLRCLVPAPSLSSFLFSVLLPRFLFSCQTGFIFPEITPNSP